MKNPRIGARHRQLWIAAVAAALSVSCAKEREPRSFVQPNAIKKVDMDGAWYYLQTVTDAPPSNGTAFVGLSSDLMKIKFDVQQDTLYARRAYEQIDGSEDAKDGDPKGYLGQPLAAWKIDKHFDVIREYNATTGEETNKIVESEERPWSQREFMRVDWSKNVITDYTGLGLSFWFANSKVEPASYWDSNPASPDALHFERAAAGHPEFAANEMNYFDLVNKVVLTPTEQTLCYGENGGSYCFTVPACFLSQQLDDCASAVLKVRHGFAKVSPKHDYEPRKWDGKQMELFGLWDVNLNRLSYNRQYGVTNSGISRHSARFNIWKKSYQADGTTPIPYKDREVRTTPYYAGSSTGTFPPDLFPVGQEVVDEWNAAAAVAVKAVTGTMPTTRVFVWCHNPVKTVADATGPADPAECWADLKPELQANGEPKLDAQGQPIYMARQGDPRRSTIFWVNQFQASGPLGYGPPLYDVQTGETISGQSYIYGAGIDVWAARARDLVLLVSGRLAADQYIDGVNVTDWVANNRTGAKNRPLLDNAQVKQRMQAMDFKWAKGLAPEAPLDRSSPAKFTESMRRRIDAVYKTGVYGRGQGDVGAARLAKLRGTPLEAMMVTPDMVAAATGPSGGSWDSLSEPERMRISPLRTEVVEKAIRQRKEKLAAVGADFADFADEGIAQRAIALARDPATMSMDPETIRQKIRRDVFKAVTLHEVGHNVGLRHNFRASYDALNYNPKYWELRSQGLQSQQRFVGLNPNTLEPATAPFAGKDCADPAKVGKLRPRWIDCPGGAISAEEATGQVSEYQYASVMDYGSEFNSDLKGLGLYDKAAMKFSYAGDGYVEVFTKVSQVDRDRQRLVSLQYFAGSYGYPAPLNLYGDSLEAIAYTQYPELFEGGWQSMYAREDVPYASISRLSENEPLMVDEKQRPMVPYFFCGDEFAGNLTCQRWDSGADVYEQAHDYITRYHNQYLLNNFKRDRYTFHTSFEYRSRILGRYLLPLRAQMTWYTLFRSIFGDFQGSDKLFNDEQGWGAFTIAVTDGFDLLGRMLTQPEPGTYGLVRAANNDVPIDHWRQISESVTTEPKPANQLTVGLIDGKFGSSTWDFDKCGYYWADECQSRIGYLLDKTLALEVLSASQAYFTGRDTSVDVRLYSIGYIVPFRKQLQEKFGALFANDYQSLAPTFWRDPKDTGAVPAVQVMHPSWTLDDPSIPKPGIIDPNAGFTLQLYAGVYALSGFPAAFDQSFVEATRVFVVGNGEAPVPDNTLMPSPGVAGPDATFDPSELVSAVVAPGAVPGTKNWLIWQDNGTGKFYAARALKRTTHEGGTTAYRVDIGTRMLEMALTLSQQVAAACGSAGGETPACTGRVRALDNYRQNIDIMRSLHNAFGYARYDGDAPFYY